MKKFVIPMSFCASMFLGLLAEQPQPGDIIDLIEPDTQNQPLYNGPTSLTDDSIILRKASNFLCGLANTCDKIGKIATAKDQEEKQKQVIGLASSVLQMAANVSIEGEIHKQNKKEERRCREEEEKRIEEEKRKEEEEKKRKEEEEKRRAEDEKRMQEYRELIAEYKKLKEENAKIQGNTQNATKDAQQTDAQDTTEKKLILDETIKLALGMVDTINDAPQEIPLKNKPTLYLSDLKELPNDDAKIVQIEQILTNKEKANEFIEELLSEFKSVLYTTIPKISATIEHNLRNILKQ